ncbi:MAG: hydrogenase/urease maturation nickel metallochaperone HypA [Candidatus Dormibacteraeota bacterium]|nr:hydrogenase/urease maturation nickel metallochaperone HypA [Candidatus Dormibacteraeota bacterium]
MHELSMCEGILDVVLEAAQKRPVRRVQVTIGNHWAVSPESFEQSFQVAAQDTPAQGAVVEQQQVSGEVLTINEIELEGGVVLRNPTLPSA